MVLTKVIKDKIAYLKTNIELVDLMFTDISLTDRQKLKTYIMTNGLKVVRGYPRNISELPAYVVLLGEEQESEAFIGNFVGEDADNYEEEDLSETQRVKSHDGLFFVQTDNKPLVNVNFISYAGVDYYTEFEVVDYEQGIIALHLPVDPETYDEVDIEFTRKTEGFESYGTFFSSQYRIESWTDNGDLTVLLYHLLKWIFLASRKELNDKGYITQNIGGSDFEPLPEYLPAFIYRRALSIMMRSESYAEQKVPFISDIVGNGELDSGGDSIG